MQEGKINRDMIKDCSSKKQAEYCRDFYKEVTQEASFKRRNWDSDSSNTRKKCIDNTMNRLQSEGLVKDVKGFLINGLKLK